MIERELKAIFGDDVRFDYNERLLYTHDLNVMPNSVEKLIIRTLPDAVVLPTRAEQLAELLRLAGKYSIPIVPRGAGTTADGSSLPVKGGIVINFTKMNKILNVDEEAQTVIVEPGVVWSTLERRLSRKGLALRCYPSSAPAATVGGWIAYGGSGIGSFSNGSIGDQVIELEVVTADGAIKSYSEDLDLFIGCEGITGLITSATIKVEKKRDLVPVLVSFEDLDDFCSAMYPISENYNPYAVSFKTPALNRMTNEAMGITGDDKGRYTILMAFEKRVLEVLWPTMEDTINGLNGQIHDEVEAGLEWEERFYQMRMKRLGPSMVSADVSIPLGKLRSSFISILALDKTAGLGGQVIDDNKVLLHTYFLDDERRFLFEFGWGKPLAAINRLIREGGMVASPGLWFVDLSKRYFGVKYSAIKKFKNFIDRKGILNPGKIFASGSKLFFFLLMHIALKPARALMIIGNDLYKYRQFKPLTRGKKEDEIWQRFV